MNKFPHDHKSFRERDGEKKRSYKKGVADKKLLHIYIYIFSFLMSSYFNMPVFISNKPVVFYGVSLSRRVGDPAFLRLKRHVSNETISYPRDSAFVVNIKTVLITLFMKQWQRKRFEQHVQLRRTSSRPLSSFDFTVYVYKHRVIAFVQRRSINKTNGSLSVRFENRVVHDFDAVFTIQRLVNIHRHSTNGSTEIIFDESVCSIFERVA